MTDSIVLERTPVSKRIATAHALTRRRVYILPTRYGLLFGSMIAVMLIGGINYNNSMAYVLTFILSSVVLVGILSTYRNLAGLVITAQRPEAVFCGQTAAFPILVDNRDHSLRCSIEFLNRRRGSWLRSPQVLSHSLYDIPAGELQSVHITQPTGRRGRVTVGRVDISSTFPLGLFRAWAHLEHDKPCLVYPKPEGRLPLPDTVLVDHHELTGQRGGADDFAGFRAYRPGDSANAISWKHFARERDLLVKRFQGQGSHKLMLDLQQVYGVGSIERALSQLCRWLLLAEQRGMIYGLELGTQKILPGSGERHLQQCLETLADYGQAQA